MREILARRLQSPLVQSPYRDLYQALYSEQWAEAKALILEFERDKRFTNASNQALARIYYHRFTQDPMPFPLPLGYRAKLVARNISIKIQHN